ncbi:hypothetical protein FBUS_09475, partial [Fasciolopsis buskii]
RPLHSACCLFTVCPFYAVRLIFLLRAFFWSLNNIREPLDRLDRLREYVQNGGSDSEKQETSSTASKDFEDHRIPLHGPVTLLTRTVFMRLLCAVKIRPLHSACCLFTVCPFYAVRLIFLLRAFFWSLNNIREPLDRLDRLREYVQNGGSDSEKQETSSTASKDFEDHRIPLHGPVTLLTRTVFMRLLCAVKM